VISAQQRRLLLVHAHPDDETISTGGTIAKYAAEGTEVFVVTCTLGEEGEIIPPELNQLGSEEGDQLGGYRAGELARACSILGVTKHRYLGGIGRWRDSGMRDAHLSSQPRAFAGGVFRDQVAQLGELLNELRPQVVVSYDSFGGYGHPDHIRAHQITMAAAPVADSVLRVFHTALAANVNEQELALLRKIPDLPFTVPANEEVPTVPGAKINCSIILDRYRKTKIKALREHTTQISVWPADGDSVSKTGQRRTCFALSNGLASAIPECEDFLLAYGRAAGVEFDLFGGL
jgi:N-acetyl-1-D-myo-inositol-2-amino-2-deoxy-alpha-D-glucopyranoside deacetylase